MYHGIKYKGLRYKLFTIRWKRKNRNWNDCPKSSDVDVCRISCNHCPSSGFNNDEKMFCTELEIKHPEKAIEIVQRLDWSDEMDGEK